MIDGLLNRIASHPHGCVSWNDVAYDDFDGLLGHTLTGVWVEIAARHHEFGKEHRHTLTGVWVEMTKRI